MFVVRINVSVVNGSDLELPKKGGLGLRRNARALYRIESKGTACKAGNFQLTGRLFRRVYWVPGALLDDTGCLRHLAV